MTLPKRLRWHCIALTLLVFGARQPISSVISCDISWRKAFVVSLEIRQAIFGGNYDDDCKGYAPTFMMIVCDDSPDRMFAGAVPCLVEERNDDRLRRFCNCPVLSY